jgi:predicted nucleic acid-binding protein
VFVSTEVINEVCVNLSKRALFSERQVQQLIESFYAKYVVIEFSKSLWLKAATLREQHVFSFEVMHAIRKGQRETTTTVSPTPAEQLYALAV